ncbi:protein LIKE EARLY STARVATION, chloroplastic-like [Bidens hawaiensis]|uniref:protein LIKE EARLY STARVATION, chloroplastic-like n=1 Tax=Bidens hawaiensis TaxID=980011 RepID=UPI00404974A7
MASRFHLTFTFTPRQIFHHHPPATLLFPSRKQLYIGRVRVQDGGNSYLGMWKNAMDRERKAMEFNKIAENKENDGDYKEDLEMKSSEFMRILEVPKEERDRVQSIQVIDRAAAAIAVASTLLKEEKMMNASDSEDESNRVEDADQENDDGDGFGVVDSQQGSASIRTPGPNFWSWIPPSDSNADDEANSATSSTRTSPYPNQSNPVMELEPSITHLSLPFESKTYNPSLPPFQSLMEVEKQDMFSTNAEDAAHALAEVDVDSVSSHGANPEGSKWWKETGTEVRADGVVCKWTLTRGVSADKSVEWEEKYWEAADEFGYKELGSEKSGRDASGNVWREFWKESMSEIDGCLHIEKTADKWGKNGKGDEWQEKWFEHYGAGQAEKWAHKWCSIDPTTKLEAGHAHVWHERWGEKYDGQGGSIKYTDKWAERSEGDRWTKWGDKWDEHFDQNGHGVKQGETWWEGAYGERWNKTWGEGHNGSGWVHKYGKSSCGQHWDTHVQQETWYERFPHYGFYHCYENSVPLRQVKNPSES